jgi:hypothetical protein
MDERANFHEQFRPELPPKPSSSRTFGVVFAKLFAVIGFLPALDTGDVRGWAVGLAAAFAVVTLLLPRALAPLLWLWMRFGSLLHKVMNPLFLGLIFFCAVAPTGLLMRVFGRRPLQLDFNSAAKSYWIPRLPPGPAPQSMKNQF